MKKTVSKKEKYSETEPEVKVPVRIPPRGVGYTACRVPLPSFSKGKVKLYVLP